MSKITVVIAICVILMAMTSVLSITTAHAQDSYYIKSQLNGYVLDIEYGNPLPGANVIVYPQKDDGTSNQLWQLVPK